MGGMSSSLTTHETAIPGRRAADSSSATAPAVAFEPAIDMSCESASRLSLLQPLQNSTSYTFRSVRSHVTDDRLRDVLDAVTLQAEQRAIPCIGCAYNCSRRARSRAPVRQPKRLALPEATLLTAPRRGVHDRRAAVHDRSDVRDYPTTLTGMMIEQRYGAEAIGHGCRVCSHDGGQ